MRAHSDVDRPSITASVDAAPAAARDLAAAAGCRRGADDVAIDDVAVHLPFIVKIDAGPVEWGTTRSFTGADSGTGSFSLPIPPEGDIGRGTVRRCEYGHPLRKDSAAGPHWPPGSGAADDRQLRTHHTPHDPVAFVKRGERLVRLPAVNVDDAIPSGVAGVIVAEGVGLTW